MDQPPVQAFEPRRQLRRRQAHHSVLDPWPTERSLLQALCEQAQTRSIPEDQLDPICPLGTEHIDRACERISVHVLAHQRSKPFHSLAEVDRLGRHHHPDYSGRADHRFALSAWTMAAIIAASAPRPARIVTPSTSSVIPPTSKPVRGPALRCLPDADVPAAITAGTNSTSVPSLS